MKYNSDFKYDLQLGQSYENQLASISDIEDLQILQILLEMESTKVEVKRDYQAMKTGNIFVEYQSRGNLSGISTTQADYYCYFLSDEHFIMSTTNRIKQMCRRYWNTKRNVWGGDSNSSRGILLPLIDFVKR